MIERIRLWARRLKAEVLALWIAARDRRTPWPARVIAVLVAGYALSPIDLIPDFIPVLGLLDDLVIVPAGVWLALRFIPEPLMEEFRERAGRLVDRPVSTAATITIVTIWIAALAVLVYVLTPYWEGMGR